ncbi:hypothetical protein ACS0TY_015321 [Phlomoides rotata]
MAEDNPNGAEIERAVNEEVNEVMEQEVQGRNRQEVPNAQGGGGPQQIGKNQGPYWNAQGYYPPPPYPYPPYYQPPYPQGQYPPYIPPYQEPPHPPPQVPHVNQEPIPQPQEGRPIREFLEPQVWEYYDGIARPNVAANNFEINAGMIRLLQAIQFLGKNWHDAKLRKKNLKPGDKVLMFNSRMNLFGGKLKSKWIGPLIVKKVYPSGFFDLVNKKGEEFKVNGHRVKPYLSLDEEGVVEELKLQRKMVFLLILRRMMEEKHMDGVLRCLEKMMECAKRGTIPGPKLRIA